MLTILKLIFIGIIKTNICTGADNLGIDAHNHKVTNCNSCRPLGPYLLRCISFEKWGDQTLLQGTPILDKRSDSGCLEGSGMRDQSQGPKGSWAPPSRPPAGSQNPETPRWDPIPPFANTLHTVMAGPLLFWPGTWKKHDTKVWGGLTKSKTEFRWTCTWACWDTMSQAYYRLWST